MIREELGFVRRENCLSMKELPAVEGTVLVSALRTQKQTAMIAVVGGIYLPRLTIASNYICCEDVSSIHPFKLVPFFPFIKNVGIIFTKNCWYMIKKLKTNHSEGVYLKTIEKNELIIPNLCIVSQFAFQVLASFTICPLNSGVVVEERETA